MQGSQLAKPPTPPPPPSLAWAWVHLEGDVLDAWLQPEGGEVMSLKESEAFATGTYTLVVRFPESGEPQEQWALTLHSDDEMWIHCEASGETCSLQ